MTHKGPMLCLWCCTKLALRGGRIVCDPCDKDWTDSFEEGGGQ